MLKQLFVAASVAAVVATIPLRAEIVEQVVVKVNGEIITKTEFEARQVAELRNRPELAKASAGNADGAARQAISASRSTTHQPAR